MGCFILSFDFKNGTIRLKLVRDVNVPVVGDAETSIKSSNSRDRRLGISL